jgi:protein tyrosine phosphatase
MIRVDGTGNRPARLPLAPLALAPRNEAPPMSETSQLFQTLCELTQMPEGSGAPPDDVARFIGLEFAPSFIRSSAFGGRLINAHRMSGGFIATQAPLESALGPFADMLASEAGLVVDLTTLSDRVFRSLVDYCPGKSHEIGNLPGCVTFHADAVAPLEYPMPADSLRKRLHVSVRTDAGESKATLEVLNVPIPDSSGLAPFALNAVVDYVAHWQHAHPNKTVVVHCSAGVGRTGLLIAACLLKEAHRSGQLHEGSLKDVVKDIVLKLRAERCSIMVQSEEQLAALLGYGRQLASGQLGASPAPQRAEHPTP